jgi:hypothetical protein
MSKHDGDPKKRLDSGELKSTEQAFDFGRVFNQLGDNVGRLQNDMVAAVTNVQVQKQYVASISPALATQYVRGRDIVNARITSGKSGTDLADLTASERKAVETYQRLHSDLPSKIPFYNKEVLARDLERDIVRKAAERPPVVRSEIKAGPAQAAESSKVASERTDKKSATVSPGREKTEPINSAPPKVEAKVRPEFKEVAEKPVSQRRDNKIDLTPPKSVEPGNALLSSLDRRPVEVKKTEKTEKVEKVEKLEKAEKTEKIEKLAKTDNVTPTGAATTQVVTERTSKTSQTQSPEKHSQEPSRPAALTDFSNVSRDKVANVTQAPDQARPPEGKSLVKAEEDKSSFSKTAESKIINGQQPQGKLDSKPESKQTDSRFADMTHSEARPDTRAKGTDFGSPLDKAKTAQNVGENQRTSESRIDQSSEKITSRLSPQSNYKVAPLVRLIPVSQSSVLNAIRNDGIKVASRLDSSAVQIIKTKNAVVDSKISVTETHLNAAVKTIRPVVEHKITAVKDTTRTETSSASHSISDKKHTVAHPLDHQGNGARLNGLKTDISAQKTSLAVPHLLEGDERADRKYISGPEIALAAIIALAGTSRLRSDNNVWQMEGIAIVQNVQVEPADSVFTERTAGDKHAGDRKPSGMTQPQSTSIMLRPKVLVNLNDTLVSIAEQLFNDASLGWLIFDVNKSFKAFEIEGRTVVRLRSRQEILIPVYQDIVDFRREGRQRKIENLVTIVEETELDREVLESGMAPLLGHED